MGIKCYGLTASALRCPAANSKRTQWIYPDSFFRIAAGAGGPHTLSTVMHLGKYSANYLAIGLTSTKNTGHKRKSLQKLARAATHIVPKKTFTCKAKRQISPTHQILIYIVQGDKILMNKDERDTYWVPYIWYHKQTDSRPMSALKHALRNMQVSVDDIKLKNWAHLSMQETNMWSMLHIFR